MQDWEITVEGIVQGVGFRPFVYQLAMSLGIHGTVSNGVTGVKVRFTAEEKTAMQFYQEIHQRPPSLARIRHHEMSRIDGLQFSGFEIVESDTEGPRSLGFAPDYALCNDCLSEMQDPHNRRYGYSFITCTQCGPRFSIISGMPYDRPTTSMADFQMCDQCLAEYHDPSNRRHFSQTNSCPECGIQMWLVHNGEICSRDSQEIPLLVSEAWKAGKIVAIKGIGGYLLTCDAENAAAIAEMRRRKQRPAKPFALMFPSLASLAEFDLTSAQIEALTRHEAPIILLEKPAQSSLAPGLADELPELGVMLPYAPLFARILTEASHPIVATSANVSHAPIVADEQQQTVLTALADLILHHNRPIISPQDDSVIRFSPKHQQRIILRRSRGIAPNFFGHKQKAELSLIAAGADMKSAFGILHEGQYYLSQYLGDLSHYDTQLRYQTVSAHLQEVLIHHPTAVLTDKHPEYISRRIGQDIGSRANLDVHDFFHHHAHFAAVMAEHDLFEQEKVIGVIWDGSGWGGNAELWGGEMFEWEKPFMQRLGHIQTFPNLAGDKMAREPRLCSFAMLNDEKDVRAKFTEKELKIYDRLIQNASLQSSSMGRLFDAAASVLDICQKQGFEGEAAMKLEGLGYAFWRQNQLLPEGYPMDYDAPVLDGRKLLLAMLQDRQEGQRIGEIALKFHVTLCQFVAHIARKHQAKHIAFSGGVFQNALLVDLMIDSLEKDFSLHFHEQLSPNDENIALGQMALYQLRLQNMYAEN